MRTHLARWKGQSLGHISWALTTASSWPNVLASSKTKKLNGVMQDAQQYGSFAFFGMMRMSERRGKRNKNANWNQIRQISMKQWICFRRKILNELVKRTFVVIHSEFLSIGSLTVTENWNSKNPLKITKDVAFWCAFNTRKCSYSTVLSFLVKHEPKGMQPFGKAMYYCTVHILGHHTET